jgi:alpha-ketoglutarate-dependent taurine dioxygenase
MANTARTGINMDGGQAPFTVTPVAGAVGAEISGIDLRGPLDAATIEALRRVFLTHLVLFFRDQRNRRTG